MRNCLTCTHACTDEDYREAYCLAYGTNVYIPLDDTECNAYKPREEES